MSQLDESNPNSSNLSEVLKEVYQTLAVRQRPPPKGGYPYPKNDHVTTKMVKAVVVKSIGTRSVWTGPWPKK